MEHSKDLNIIVDKLRNTYEVFVTQLSIDERISQQYLELKNKYDKVDELANEIKSFAKVEFLLCFDDCFQSRKKGFQTNYENLFPNKIIPFSKSSETFSKIIERVYKKTPPFIKSSSDKGFKDTILWLSLLDYFSQNEYFSSVLFVTNDHGFTESKTILQQEFQDCTGLLIEIKENSFLNEKLFPKPHEETICNEISQEDLSELRYEVQDVINGICNYEAFYGFGESIKIKKYFSTSEVFTEDSVQSMFEDLNRILNNKIFYTSFTIIDLFPYQNSFRNICSIPRGNVENLKKIYDKVNGKYKQFVPQLVKVTTEMLNQNFEDELFPETIPF